MMELLLLLQHSESKLRLTGNLFNIEHLSLSGPGGAAEALVVRRKMQRCLGFSVDVGGGMNERVADAIGAS